MGTVQLIQVTPNELADLISENVKAQLKEFLQQSSEQPSQEAKEFLTRRETADLFNVSLVTLHSWSNNGTLKPYRMGNRTYFKRSELMETLFSSNRG